MHAPLDPADASEMRLQLGESLFDGVEAGAVGRQDEEAGAALSEDRLGLCSFMRGEVVDEDGSPASSVGTSWPSGHRNAGRR